MAIDRASDPVVPLAIFHRQQPHDHVRPQREGSLWPTPWHHHRLPNPEPMSRHGGYLGWHRTEGNGGCRLPLGLRPSAAREAADWRLEKTGWVTRNLWRTRHQQTAAEIAFGLPPLGWREPR